MGIEISHIGNYQYPSKETAILVEDNVDYVKACQKLSMADSDSPLSVLVRQKVHYTWLRNFTEQIGLYCSFSEKTPRIILAHTWGVSIPDWLTDEMVLSQNLLELDIPEKHPYTFQDTVLGAVLGEEFSAPKLDVLKLSDIISVVVKQDTKDKYLQYPVLIRCLREKCVSWGDQSEKPWVKEICRSLPENSESLWEELTLWAILSGYPERLLEFVLPQSRVLFLRNVPPEVVRDIHLHSAASDQAVAQIELFFSDIGKTATTDDDFQKVIHCASGRLSNEFHLLLQLIEANHIDLSQKSADLLKERFKACPGVSSIKLVTLQRFVKMPKPQMILGKEETIPAEEWVRWVVEEYIPYRNWQTQNRVFDSEVEKVIAAFTDWYLKEYQAIQQNFQKGLIHVLGEWSESITNDDLSIVIMADSLSLTFWKLFVDALSGSGFHTHEVSYRYAPLPTITEVSKPLVLSGVWASSEKNYESILEKRAKNDWCGKGVSYFPNVKALTDHKIAMQSSILVLNLLDGDELLHSDVEAKGSTYEEEIYRMFLRLADAVRTVFDGWVGNPEKFGLYVISDHGASRILEEEKQSFDSKVISKLFENEKQRFASIKEDEAVSIPENLWAFGYRFVQTFIHDGLIYFIPRGHNTVKVKGGISSAFSHGGASPEEVIVPCAVFRAVRAEWKNPFMRFVKLTLNQETGKAIFYIQRITQVQVEIRNPNAASIRFSKADVLNPECDVRGYDTPMVAGGGSSILTVDCYFGKGALQESELLLQFTYEIAGEAHLCELKTDAEFRSVTTGGFSVKDLK